MKSEAQYGGNKFALDNLGLGFYSDVPSCEVSTREFEELTCDRLKILHAIDRLAGYDMPLAKFADVPPKLLSQLEDARLILKAPMASKEETFLEEKAEFCRRDSISHYALRLAFCKTRDAKDWLAKQEQRLFVLRFEQLSAEAKDAFFEASRVVKCRRHNPSALEERELPEKIRMSKLKATTAGARFEESSTFYEMPFGDVPASLLSGRRIVLHKGKAYVPQSSLKLILAARFKERLQEGLEEAFAGLPAALANPSVGPFLRMMQDHGLRLLISKPGSDSSEDLGPQLSLENFEEYRQRSMPPCMRRLIEKQRETRKHLKHAGRLQLRPFLKGCGLTFDESMRWWRQELTLDPSVSSIVFEKNYTYDVDHTYGRKGNLQGGHCFGCAKIIDFPYEAAGQTHGCPFKHLEVHALRQQLHAWKLDEAAASEIQKLIHNGKHYQLACVEYFKALHPGSEGDGVGNSPMDYFQESCRFHKKQADSKKEQAQN